MRLKQTNNVMVTVKDNKTKKSKTITVYDCDIETMILAIKKIVELNDK